MPKIKSISEWATHLLLIKYIIEYLFLIETDWYYNNYNGVVSQVDGFLFIISFVGAFLYIEEWRNQSKLSFAAIITLIALTQIDIRNELTYYYEFYAFILLVFSLKIIIFTPIRR